jgi:nitric oxide reductase large subunit
MTGTEVIIGYVVGAMAWGLLSLVSMALLLPERRRKHSARSTLLGCALWPLPLAVCAVLLVSLVIAGVFAFASGGIRALVGR